MVDARARADEAVLGLRDHEVTPPAADPARLAEDDRQFLPSGLQPSLGLRDDLLGDHEYITVREAAAPLDGVTERASQVVAGRDLRDPDERDDPDLAGGGHAQAA